MQAFRRKFSWLGFWALLVLVIGMIGAGLAGLHVCDPAFKARIAAKIEERLQDQGVRLELGDTLDWSWKGGVSTGPVRVWIGRKTPVGEPLVTIQRVVVRPSFAALVRGELRVGRVELDGVLVDLDEASAGWMEFSGSGAGAREKTRAQPKSAFAWPAIDLCNVQVRLRAGLLAGRQLPLTFSIARVGVQIGGDPQAASRVRVEVALDPGGRAHAELLRGAGQPWRVQLDWSEIPLAVLNTLATAEGLKVQSGVVSGQGEVLWSRARQQIQAKLSARFKDVLLDGERLSPESVGPFGWSLGAEASWDGQQRLLLLEKARLVLGDLESTPLTLSARVEASPRGSLLFEAHWKDIDTRHLLAKLPRALTPGAGTPTLAGPLSAWLRLSGPTQHPPLWNVEGDVDLSRLVAVLGDRPFTLRAPFVHEVIDPWGHKHEIAVGPQSSAFVPIGTLPPHVLRAVTLSEDAGFFGHRGFDFAELVNSLRAVFVSGKAVRGGSTITQQLAKNLFLSREKTVARKVQEAILTLALESSVPKRRLLEIYLNIIEWGPGLYGLGRAAQHYFGKSAAALTPKEAAFLASIIPNPVRYYVYYQRGALTDSWETRVEDVLTKMLVTGAIGEEEYALALESPLQFNYSS